MKLVCAPALLALSGAATPSIAPLPNSFGIGRDLLLERIGPERREQRAAARQDAEQRAEGRAAQDRHHDALEVFAARHQAGDLRHGDFAVHRIAEIGDDLADAEHAHGQDDEVQPVAEFRNVEAVARHAGIDVRTDEAEQEAEQDHAERMQQRAVRQHDGGDEAEHHQREIFGRPEFQGNAGERRCEQHDDQGRDRAGEERADGGGGERRARTALTRHLVAVERGDDGRTLARQVDEDRRGRAAILRAVIDAGEHDERGFGRQAEGQRQEHGDGGDGSEARQHADGRAEQDAEEAVEQVDRAERGVDAQQKVGEQIGHALSLRTRCRARAGERRGPSRTRPRRT